MGAGRPVKLTAETEKVLLAYIRQGAFDWVAAVAAGITRQTFHNWMTKGREAQQGEYKEFFDKVSKAKAEARIVAEHKVWDTMPFNYLRYGPGRERPGEPGWTEGHEITGPEGKELVVNIVRRPAEKPDRAIPDTV